MTTVNEAPTKCQLADRVFVDIGTDREAVVVLTTEVHGRTTNRIVLSIAAAQRLQTFLASVQASPVRRAEESTKKLRP
jgi:hypothetical protein